MNTTAQHTPGPWTAGGTGHAGIAILGDPEVLVAYARGDANARLIAAAPEMLEALQQVLGLIDGGSLDIAHGDRRETERDVASLRTLLAKIEGAE